MTERDTDPKPDEETVLSPIFPSETPSIPGSGRTWFALLFVLYFLLGGVYVALELLFGL